MSATHQPVERPAPADLPPDELITYDQFAHAFGPNPPKRETIERYARKNLFVRGVRLGGPRKPMQFRAGDVALFFAERMAGLDVETGPINQIDKLHPDSSDEDVEAVIRTVLAAGLTSEARRAAQTRLAIALGMTSAVLFKLMRTIEAEVAAEATA